MPTQQAVSHNPTAQAEHFDKLAEERGYAQWGRETAAGRRRLERRARLLSQCFAGSQRILELGCGAGSLTQFVDYTGCYVATDISKAQLDLVRLKGFRSDPAALQADVMKLPFPNGLFDVVFGNGILHHVDLRLVSAEIHRVLRPGGRFWFAEPNRFNPELIFARYCEPLKKSLGQSEDEVPINRFRARTVFTEAGFSSVSAEPFDWLHPAVPPALIGIFEATGKVLEKCPLIKELSGNICLTGRK